MNTGSQNRNGNALRKVMAGRPVSSLRFCTYTFSMYSHGIIAANRTQRLSLRSLQLNGWKNSSTVFIKAKTEIGADGVLMAALSEEDVQRVAELIPECTVVRFDCGP